MHCAEGWNHYSPNRSFTSLCSLPAIIAFTVYRIGMYRQYLRHILQYCCMYLHIPDSVVCIRAVRERFHSKLIHRIKSSIYHLRRTPATNVLQCTALHTEEAAKPEERSRTQHVRNYVKQKVSKSNKNARTERAGGGCSVLIVLQRPLFSEHCLPLYLFTASQPHHIIGLVFI